MMFRAGRESDQASFTRLPQSLISRKPYHICCWGKRWGSVPARIERVLVLLDELDGDPYAEPSRACAGLWSALGTIRTGRARTTTASPTTAGMFGCAAGRTRCRPSASRRGGACEAADADRSG